jgi:hypothetical protein
MKNIALLGLLAAMVGLVGCGMMAPADDCPICEGPCKGHGPDAAAAGPAAADEQPAATEKPAPMPSADNAGAEEPVVVDHPKPTPKPDPEPRMNEVSARTLARVEKAIQTKDFSGIDSCDKCQACIERVMAAKPDFDGICKTLVMEACAKDDFTKVASSKKTCGELAQAMAKYKQKIAKGPAKN